MGRGERRSDQTSAGRDSAATTAPMKTGVEVNPSLPPWFTMSSKEPIAPNRAVAPMGSTWGRSPWVRSSGSTHHASSAPNTAMGTLE